MGGSGIVGGALGLFDDGAIHAVDDALFVQAH